MFFDILFGSNMFCLRQIYYVRVQQSTWYGWSKNICRCCRNDDCGHMLINHFHVCMNLQMRLRDPYTPIYLWNFAHKWIVNFFLGFFGRFKSLKNLQKSSSFRTSHKSLNLSKMVGAFKPSINYWISHKNFPKKVGYFKPSIKHRTYQKWELSNLL